MAIKYELDTIPVIDAFKSDCECAFCLLAEKSEKKYLEFYLGNSIMIPEQRVLVNRHGFCARHFRSMLESRKTPHGLGLMAHTHLKETNDNLQKILDRLGENLDKPKNSAKNLTDLRTFLTAHTSDCLICGKIEDHMKRYLYTAVAIWKKQDDFKSLFSASRGFCLRHAGPLSEMAEDQLSGNEQKEFFSVLIGLMEKNYARLEKEILWFTQKFDYQNNDKDWGTSKDALERTIMKLEGIYLEKS
jgi:hypothetical protein